MIAVTAPNGNVGSETVRALLRAGVRPRVLTRHPESLPQDFRERTDVVAVDLRDHAAVVASLRGIQSLSWITPSPALDESDPLAYYDELAETLQGAVTSNAIGRVVFQSSVGAERRNGVGEIDGLAATEQRLDALGIDVVHLRCGLLMSNLLLDPDALNGGTIRVLLPLDLPMPWVAPRDVAEVTAARLLSPHWSGREVQALHGPEHLTWSEVAEVLSSTLSRPIQVERVRDEAMRGDLRASGLTEQRVAAIIGMSTGIRDDFIPEQRRDVTTTTPTTLRAWAIQLHRSSVSVR